MKQIKNLNILMQGIVMIALFSFAVQLLFGISMVLTAIVLVAISLFIAVPKGTLCAGVFREMWTGQLLKYLQTTAIAPFLDGLPDFSGYVSSVGDEAQVIHLVAMDVLPEVLINNTTYPIPLQSIGEDDVVVMLDKYITLRTPITDDELFANTYKKMDALVQRHGLSISINKNKKAIHALAPGNATDKMPVLLTSGGDDGTGRKRLLWDDVVALKRQLDNLEIPEEDRRLVLCSDHVNDLIVSDQRFQNQYYQRETGKIFSQLGFELMDYAGNPYFTPETKTKLSFGAIPAATDRKASVFFAKSRTAKAIGWTKMYFSIAAEHPETQQNEINFRHYFITMPTREEARGAIISANAA